MASCTKENEETINEAESPVVMNENERSLSDFAVILSKAINQEPELREFIRNEALKQFDKDHDVFYPFVKDAMVAGDKTFRDILADYDYENKLSSIELELPLLDILVPDWSWIAPECFSVNNWDTEEDKVSVTYRTSEKEQRIYQDGKYIQSVSRDNIPSDPVLIVKDNERMKIKNTTTKSALCREDYEFIDDVFKNTGTTKGDGGHWGNPWLLDAPLDDDPDEIPIDVLKGRTATAYYQNGVPQRDHIYYGMTETCDSGSVDYNYQETIYRIKLVNPENNGYYDDTDDFKLREHRKTGQTANYTAEELKELIWADGALELVFIIKAGKDNCDSKPFTVSFSQAFQIDKYELVNKYNWLGAKKSIYAKIDDSYLVPKWIFVNIPLFTWDVRTCPSKYKIVVIEKDSGISKTVTETEEVEYMNNTTSDASGTFNDYVKIGYNSGNKETVKKKITYSYQMTQSCDSLGSVDVEYKRAIITDYPSASLAHVAEARSGGVDIQIIPLRK